MDIACCQHTAGDQALGRHLGGQQQRSNRFHRLHRYRQPIVQPGYNVEHSKPQQYRYRCQPCHAGDAPQRYGAPEHATFDTETQTRDQAAAIRATVLDGRSMPVGGGLSLEDEAQLSAWLCTVEASP